MANVSLPTGGDAQFMGVVVPITVSSILATTAVPTIIYLASRAYLQRQNRKKDLVAIDQPPKIQITKSISPKKKKAHRGKRHSTKIAEMAKSGAVVNEVKAGEKRYDKGLPRSKTLYMAGEIEKAGQTGMPFENMPLQEDEEWTEVVDKKKAKRLLKEEMTEQEMLEEEIPREGGLSWTDSSDFFRI
jgi:hypothetical protein